MLLAKNSAETAQIHVLSPLFCITLFTVDSSWFRFLADSLRGHFLAPQSQGLLHRAVGKTEQYRVLTCLVRDFAPRGHHENIVRRPLEYLTSDNAATLPLDDTTHGSIGRAVGRTLEAGRQ